MLDAALCKTLQGFGSRWGIIAKMLAAGNEPGEIASKLQAYYINRVIPKLPGAEEPEGHEEWKEFVLKIVKADCAVLDKRFINDSRDDIRKAIESAIEEEKEKEVRAATEKRGETATSIAPVPTDVEIDTQSVTELLSCSEEPNFIKLMANFAYLFLDLDDKDADIYRSLSQAAPTMTHGEQDRFLSYLRRTRDTRVYHNDDSDIPF
jgi:hypothetical protein